MKPINITPENESRFAQWLKARGGIAVWKNCNLSDVNVGQEAYTPALTNYSGEGFQPTMSPHWKYSNKPDRVITDAALVTVTDWQEVRRVNIRRGRGPWGFTPADAARLERLMKQEGDDCTWLHSPADRRGCWREVIIQRPGATRPLLP